MRFNPNEVEKTINRLENSKEIMRKVSYDLSKIILPEDFDKSLIIKSRKNCDNIILNINRTISKLKSDISEFRKVEKDNISLSDFVNDLFAGMNSISNAAKEKMPWIIDKAWEVYLKDKAPDTFFKLFPGDYGVDQGLFRGQYFYDEKTGKLVEIVDYIKGTRVLFNDLRDYICEEELTDVQLRELEQQFGEKIINVTNYSVAPVYGESNLDSLVEKLSERYNMSKKDVIKTFSALDSIGACTYAAFANSLIQEYSTKPSEFKEDFGFPLYEINSQGKMSINSDELLFDMFVSANTIEKPKGETFSGNWSFISGMYYHNDKGELVFNTEYEEKEFKFLEAGNETEISSQLAKQRYMRLDYGIPQEYTNKRNKELSLQYENLKLGTAPSKWIKNLVNDAMDAEYQVQLIIGPDTHLSGESGNKTYVIPGYHAVYVTKADDKDVIVSSWGKELKISYEDLSKYDAQMQIINFSGSVDLVWE